jgi:HAD superfamily phosphoserine phosphatase-like hydrolase
MAEPVKLAVYDLDRTITVHGTFTPFLLRAAMKRAPWRLLGASLVLGSMILYLIRIIDRRRLKSWMLAILLGPIGRTELETLANGYYAELIRSGEIRPGALQQISADRADGRRLVLATASFDFYAQALGDALGFDQVIATKSSWTADGRLRFAVDGPNCYGNDKLHMLLAALGPDSDDVCFYSDHYSDKPCFEWASRGVAVNPSRKLARMAASLNLMIQDWNVPDQPGHPSV